MQPSAHVVAEKLRPLLCFLKGRGLESVRETLYPARNLWGTVEEPPFKGRVNDAKIDPGFSPCG